jgi:hypothetical protein
MVAGDVLVFRGDAVHCGAELTERDQNDAFSKFGDNFNFRLFSYVPSWWQVEFLVMWKPTNRFLSIFDALTPSKQTDKVFNAMNPELEGFDMEVFWALLKYARG